MGTLGLVLTATPRARGRGSRSGVLQRGIFSLARSHAALKGTATQASTSFRCVDLSDRIVGLLATLRQT
jgi:hypothetical protein